MNGKSAQGIEGVTFCIQPFWLQNQLDSMEKGSQINFKRHVVRRACMQALGS